MQTQVASSTTESEYISLSVALREVIYLQQMIWEVRSIARYLKTIVVLWRWPRFTS